MQSLESFPQKGVFRVKSLTGTHVKNSHGEDLGQIEDLVIDIDAGSIVYAVLSFGGFLGVGDKLFAIPWEALKLSKKEGASTPEPIFILDVNKERLKEAPGFDKSHWPNMANPTWGSEIHNYYGYTHR